jgi:hypothetical protein
MNKYEQLEQRLTSMGVVNDTLIIDTVLLTNQYLSAKKSATELAMFEISNKADYKIKYGLPMKDVDYNMNVVMAVESGEEFELPAHKNNLYVGEDLK